ncbi:bile acid:sodium symporter family protein [Sporomusa acidovorans]|uniref:Pantothenates transporter PanS n=1 Tax=Sporomusa acidovorans (strain ATCC 49682 / DSM 3132 / Mol) TaxID=1123286 RepID=A0ABZ3J5U9_SPOA4|nr:bile acid:sodium symporter family protein [Sporomusa acidovorans]OZC24279.1 sodium bile acid symporter family protein [Sporomusa acidovorans DSM 3132]SDF03204.1 bile acid:Na+ symporter, BASS family [Sporomusa acidovorans]
MIEKLGKVVKFITRFFSLWIILGVIAAYVNPEPFKPLAKYVGYCIMAVMLSMGLTVSVNDFKLIFSRPKDVFWGIVLRYMIMPFIALGLTKVLDLPPVLAAGLILVGCCPSGVASNVMTFLSKGDTALSITVSTINTVIAPFITPFMFTFLVGSIVPVNASAILLDILKIVLIPVFLGAVIRAYASDFVDKIMPIIPIVSVIAIFVTTSSGFALSAGSLANVAIIAVVAVVLHNLLGLTTGYWAARGVGMSHFKAKAICFEIGMENGGLAMALAIAHLAPLAFIPAAIFNLVHNLTGPTLASYWREKEEKKAAAQAEENTVQP